MKLVETITMLVTLKKLQTQSIPAIQQLLTAAFVLFSINAFCTDYYVNDGLTTGDVHTTAIGNNANTGTTAADPKLTLTNLLTTHASSFTSGDTIYIDAGNYNNEANITISASMPGISFIGAGYQSTVIDNQLAGAATNFFMYIQASNTSFSNMSVTGYENNGSQVPGHSAQAITIGGTIGSPVTGVLFENISFYNNGSSGGNPALSVLSYAIVTLRGGGSYCNSTGTAFTGGVELFGSNNTLNIEDYILSGNDKTSFDGGGIRIEGANTSFVNVSNTRVSNNRGNEGGAISQRNGTLTMTDCIINGNSTVNSGTHYGAAYRAHAGSATFSKCIFSNNVGGGSSCRGGAIGARYSGSTGVFSTNQTITIQVDSCVFENNNPGTRGRDVYAANGFSNPTNVTMVDCQFLTGGNYNLYSGTATSINATYFATPPTSTGANVTRTLSANTLFTPTPTPPDYTGVCGSIVLLPVELTSFTGHCRNKDNILQWETASENNNDYFLLEKMSNSGEFEVVGKVNGVGNSYYTSNYEWVDDDNSGVVNYYRLRQIDYNGRSTAFNEISVDQTCTSENVFYNEAENSITLFRESLPNEILSVNVLNAGGQTLYNDELHLSHKTKQSVLQLNTKLPAGIYLISYYSSVSGNHIAKLSIR